MSKIKSVAVVGIGESGSEHIKAAANNPRMRMHTICVTPRSRDKAEALREKFGAVRVTTRYEDVLADPEIDIVIICTPNSQHPDQAVPSLLAGKHTYVEKPLAVSLEGAQRIVDAQRKSGKVVQVGQDLRFFPLMETIKGLVDAGRLGDPCFVEGEFVEDLAPRLAGETHQWYKDFKHEGQLPLFCGGGRMLDMMRWIVGEIEEVSAWGTNRNLPSVPWNDTVVANIKFVNGALGKFIVSVGAKIPPSHNFSYYGTKGTVIEDKLFQNGVPHLNDFMQLPVQKKVPAAYVYATVLEHFLNCIDTGARPRIDALDGARTVAACCAVIESISTGRTVKVPAISCNGSHKHVRVAKKRAS
jgi:predicted dehydrogenase